MSNYQLLKDKLESEVDYVTNYTEEGKTIEDHYVTEDQDIINWVTSRGAKVVKQYKEGGKEFSVIDIAPKAQNNPVNEELLNLVYDVSCVLEDIMDSDESTVHKFELEDLMERLLIIVEREESRLSDNEEDASTSELTILDFADRVAEDLHAIVLTIEDSGDDEIDKSALDEIEEYVDEMIDKLE